MLDYCLGLQLFQQYAIQRNPTIDDVGPCFVILRRSESREEGHMHSDKEYDSWQVDYQLYGPRINVVSDVVMRSRAAHLHIMIS